MKTVKKPAALLIMALLLLAGCGPVLSDETLRQVDREIRFEDVAAGPSAYTGRSVVFGGTILAIENRQDRTVIEVLEQDMNSQLKPVDAEKSKGRFLVEFPDFKDPAIYGKGRLLTVAGKVKGTEERKLGERTYTYPVITPIEHYLWTEERYYDQPRIGIGVGIGFSHID